MIQSFMKSAVGYPRQQLHSVIGSIPQDIGGTYIRNGVGSYKYGNNLLGHWFEGDGVNLMLEFKDGKCWPQVKYVDTSLRRLRVKNQAFQMGLLSSLR